jgi:site-specific DNA-methyltransferase (adenine-specific)
MGKGWDYQVPSVEIWEQCLRVLKPGGHLLAFAGTRTQHRMCVNIEDAGFEIRDMIAWVYGSGMPKSHNLKGKWKGFGTSLKPSLEPVTVARKPFKGTVANNVLTHGTGAINIDGCRVGTDEKLVRPAINRDDNAVLGKGLGVGVQDEPAGRWPANLIHDGSDEVTELFPSTHGAGHARTGSKNPRLQNVNPSSYSMNRNTGQMHRFGDSGSAARFFYVPKCSKKDRDGSTHPTMKPTDLMAYLCRLVTPPGGIVLDPFMGSGSTGKAAMREGFQFIGIEREEEYIAIARERVVKPERQQLSLIA